jgi:hypothetical protein
MTARAPEIHESDELPLNATTSSSTSPLASSLEAFAKAVAPITLLTALLFYFGWVYTNSRTLYFGIDPSVIGFSTQDYLLRSVNAIFVPIGVLLTLVAVSIQAHVVIVRSIQTGRYWSLARWGSLCILGCGIALLAAGIAGVFRRPLFGIQTILTPSCLALGILGIGYASHARKTLRPLSSHPRPATPTWVRSANLLIVTGGMSLSLFWVFGDWAQALGRGSAVELASTLAVRPTVVVYSKDKLNIDGRTGVTSDEVGASDSEFRFRYTGLTLLLHSDGKYFLLPSGWSAPHGVAIVLTDSNRLRLEFTAR